jgi:hypothetical protein
MIGIAAILPLIAAFAWIAAVSAVPAFPTAAAKRV